MKKPPIRVYYTTVLKACRSHANAGNFTPPPTPSKSGQLPVTSPTTLIGPPLVTRRVTANFKNISPVSSTGNPCLDLLFNVRVDRTLDEKPPLYSSENLKQLLPKAWSHSPQTTLKLIGNLLDRRGGKDDKEGFHTAAYWLYQNHPKTLASSLPTFATLGFITDILEILYRTLEGQNVRAKDKNLFHKSYYRLREIHKGIGVGSISSKKRRDKIIAMADKTLERYRLDPNYRILHDGVSDLYAKCLKHDIQNLNNYHRMMMANDESDHNKPFDVTWAAKYFPHFDSLYDRATLLCEGIAKKVFPRGGSESQDNEEEDGQDYAQRVRKRLRQEVLVPLRKVLAVGSYSTGCNKWGYNTGYKKEPCTAQAYFEEVQANGMSEIKPDALLPDEIIDYVMDKDNKDDHDMLAAAELQWKKMVEEIYAKHGKFKNCLAVCTCDVYPGFGWMQVSVALGLLMSELSEEPWNGKVITYNTIPELVSIQGNHLKSKCEFMSQMDFGNWSVEVDIPKVFDLILQMAVNGNLKPEHMIKRVFVFSSNDFYEGSPNKWETCDYEAIQTKFKEKGFGDVVPEIVFWQMSSQESTMVVPCTKPGVKILRGIFTDNFKSFLENDGDMTLEHVMEAAISSEKYQDLIVVD